MKIGIIGLQNSGKTTIFNALTRSEAEVADYSNARAEPNLAVVNVEDERITHLTEMYKPRKTIHATVEFIDFAGVARHSDKGGFPPELVQAARITDALAVVVRNFHHDLMEEPTPSTDLESIEDEMILSDLIIVETRLERIAQDNKKGKKTPQTVLEEETLHAIRDTLNEGAPIRGMKLSGEAEKALRGFQFLTQKPLMVIVNSDEERFGKNAPLLAELGAKYRTIEFAGNFEMELSRLTEGEDIRLFMEDMGITESARSLLTRTAYELLGYISFFTVGPDEVRAWNLKRGQSAVEAAGVIHSDLARGFIRAECFSYADLLACGSEKAIKEKGLLRLEGKEYPVKDGDILCIRFNV
ncbi:MAG: redox-regulated ATPase YchF [Desulfuromonadaceae bacterium]|nr:redox-regulated ATPase YchF [Desulfuromonadaceae bacterium]